MSKTRKNGKGVAFLKKLTISSKKAIPVVASGLKSIGRAAKVVATKAAPIVEKGVAKVYTTMATGFNLGAKGVKSVAKGVSAMAKNRRSKRNRKSRK